jgi:3-hydroxyacyl-[acyl-carrier-protein] dehydratase
MSLTPHGPGFSFLDSFEILEPNKHGRGRKWLDPAAAYFADHFPGNPLMPGVLLVECTAQAAVVLWQWPGPPFPPRASGFPFRNPEFPAQHREIEVTLEKELGAFAQFDAVLRVDETVVSQGRVTLSRALSSVV